MSWVNPDWIPNRVGLWTLVEYAQVGQYGLMTTYTATEHASSKDPHDWGRAMAVALNRLLEAAQLDRDYLEHQHLLGQDIVMRCEAQGDGVAVHLSWLPQNQDDAPTGNEEKSVNDGTLGTPTDNGAEELVEGSGRGG